MASTRDVIAPPIFAEDASIIIPPTPIAGVSYRDPIAGPASSPDGWPYAQLVNSAEFNQLMFQWSSLVSIMDRKGILGWSDLKDYTEKAITFGSDGNIYVWLQESGPGTGSGVKDPISEPAYWQPLSDYVGANDTINAPIATVAAAGTINLTTGAPDTSQIAISGTGVNINGFTVAANRFFVVKMTGTNTLVNSASLVTNTSANIVTAAGDSFLMRATAANTVEILCYFTRSTQKNEASAWVNFNASGTVTMRDSFNVSGITDNGVGQFLINFMTPMANTNYAPVSTCSGPATSGLTVLRETDSTARSTSGINLYASQGTGGFIDPVYASVVIFGGK